jgi:hypothetical protein
MHFPTQLPLVLALALPALSAPVSNGSTETWSIPTMNVHLMGRDTGIPGNEWPENRKFNTTLDFTLALPSSTVQCSANWVYQQVSTDEWTCGNATDVTFHLGPTSAGTLNDITYALTVTKTNGNGS